MTDEMASAASRIPIVCCTLRSGKPSLSLIANGRTGTMMPYRKKSKEDGRMSTKKKERKEEGED